MKNNKFHEQDMEVITMVNAQAAKRRQPTVDAVDAEYVTVEDKIAVRAEGLRHAAGVVARALLGCVQLGAVTHGWADPVFGLTSAAVFFIWAVVHARRG